MKRYIKPISVILIFFCLISYSWPAKSNRENHQIIKRREAGIETNGHRHRVTGYYPAYSSKIQSPSDLNIELYTDLIFFVAATEPGLKLGYGNIPRDLWELLVQEFVKHCKAANVIPRMAIGSWGGSVYFSDLLSTNEKRHKYANFLTKYAQERGFEGLDIDWEYPHKAGIGCNKNRPDDMANFGEFLSILRKIWPKGIFSSAVPIGGFASDAGTLIQAESLRKMIDSLDYVNVMAYDVFGSWSQSTGPNAPFASTSSGSVKGGAIGASVVDSVRILTDQGFKKSQIVVGIPGYGYSYTLASPELNTTNAGGVPSQLYQNKLAQCPPGGSTDGRPSVDICGVKTGWGGTWRYRELVENGFLSKDGKNGLNGYKRHFDQGTQTPFLTKSTWLLSYDDEESGNVKAEFVKSSGVAGIFYFDTLGPTDDIIKSAVSILNS
ncbi:glycoside hydrolase superfamily [Phakopsora pachyrhizi]|nr:glycoside hydrolase superfamily [Phakopsora pachyrhizi]